MHDFAFSAESGTVSIYNTNWNNCGGIVPDQITSVSDTIFKEFIVTISARISNEYSCRDNQHPLQISTVLPAKDTANGEEGVATTYARSDHTHHVNISNSVTLKDTGTGTAGTSNIYASDTLQHPHKIYPIVVNVVLIIADAAANCSNDNYYRNNHVHTYQLTYVGSITATQFIKTEGFVTEILYANGETKIVSDIGQYFVQETGQTLQIIGGSLRYGAQQNKESGDEDYVTVKRMYNNCVKTILSGTLTNAKLPQRFVLHSGTSSGTCFTSLPLYEFDPTHR
ncbi:MAG: hypothetical protein EZS28_019347 [Streblomastix strix]|uniref:Uncharacterized protein n=1 Tax=Streblomastix strix TaxID=222440 RepID=A0A5J4VR17_9EUKA|nr:MAG: hypothetical protein EZS28_019347 [Streblomastix strix]